ncbi:MAG TPA: hypothetical protein VJX69_01610 [Terriglobales bacterium]|nr:hypothetical protein [Terriglobales bacterium]
MVKKSIAAALLVAMVAWAEMAMAPMILMHAGHLHPAREMAEHKAAHHHAMPAGHACCPGLRNPENTVPLEFAASSMPCQDEHRCCFQQGPQSVPAPASARHRLSQEIASAETAQLSLTHTESHVSPAAAVALGPPPNLLGMVLRV